MKSISISTPHSSEMWEFDGKGNLLMERAIAFLKGLFASWSNTRAAHIVTLVLFSRTFYDKKKLADFPSETWGEF